MNAVNFLRRFSVSEAFFTWYRGRVEAAQRVALSVAEGRKVTVVNPIGVGMTTLPEAIMGTLAARAKVGESGNGLDGAEP